MRGSLVCLFVLGAAVGCAHQTHSAARSPSASAPTASEPTPSQQAEAQGQAAEAQGQEAVNQAGNTAENRGDQGMTPSDQSNDARDLALTQQIRKTVVQNDGLSFEAKNVKIITQQGNVTLRGPVKSKTESQIIERAAKQVAGSDHVTNQLEIENQ